MLRLHAKLPGLPAINQKPVSVVDVVHVDAGLAFSAAAIAANGDEFDPAVFPFKPGVAAAALKGAAGVSVMGQVSVAIMHAGQGYFGPVNAAIAVFTLSLNPYVELLQMQIDVGT